MTGMEPSTRLLLRMAVEANLSDPDAAGPLASLPTAIQCSAFRSLIAPPWLWATCRPGELLPITGSVFLVPGEPFDGSDLATVLGLAREAFAAGGALLLLATERDQRDDAKRRIAAAVNALSRPQQGGRA